MNIGINTRLLLPNRLEGIGWFTYEVIKRITQQHPEHTFYLFFDRKYDDQFLFSDNCVPVVLYPQARHPILYKIWFNYSIPKALKKYQIDLFFSPDGFLSLKTKVPQIPVIHDLNFEHIPEDLPSKDTKHYQKYMPQFAKIAEHIITVSNFSKSDIVNSYQVSSDKITVAYNGASELFTPLSLEMQSQVRTKWSEGEPYFVYVGALHKRKNIANMLKAYDVFKSETKSKLKFIIVGERLFKSPDIDEVYSEMAHAKDVIFTGRLNQQQLTQVIASAKAMIYISYFEGFGIPVLEALKCGIRVLTSNTTSLPEVGGDAAIYCDPKSIKSISDGLNEVSKTEISQEKLLTQANKFSWNHTAEVCWQVMEKVINEIASK